MDTKVCTSNLLGSVGNECMVIEAFELLKDANYGFVHSNNNLPAAGCNQVSKKVTMKKVRSEQLKRRDYRILSSKFRDVFFATNIKERIIKKQISNILPKDMKNNEAVLESTSSNEVSNKKIKKRKVDNEKSRKPSKKQKNQVQEEQPELPFAFKEKIEQMEGSEVKLVIQKDLTRSDVNKNEGRLSVPGSKVVEESVLTPTEKSSLDYVPQQKKERKKIVGMSVGMLDPSLDLWDGMSFKKWKMLTNEVYVITGGWYDIVEKNELKEDQKVQLWSFRRNKDLYFALVKL